MASTVDAGEIERFSRIAGEWWDENGKFAPLHRLNPARIGFIRDRVAAHYGREPLDLGPDGKGPLHSLSMVDIGCGGGLVCEPMARLGATITGIDASERNIGVARLHAERMGLSIDYYASTAEALRDQGKQYDVVLALEIVEHVADVDLFLACCADLVKPGGVLILSTLNRTTKAFALAIVGAEYVMRWLPRGTHDWRKFLKPSEVARGLRAAGLQVEELAGIVYSPITGRWRIDRHDLDVNYMLLAARPRS